MKPGQLPLAMRWPPQQRFASYRIGENGAGVALLRRAASEADATWVFLHGAPASGKTHLLIAACAAAGAQGRHAQYVSLRALPQRGVAYSGAPDQAANTHHAGQDHLANAIRALGGSELLAIDDLDAIAGNRTAEHALFDLYNRCKVEKSTLLFAAAQAPAQIGIMLPDLVSRLSSCTQAVLKPLSDEGRRDVLRERGAARGIVLDDAALDWLFTRVQRDLGSLTGLLDRLDRESLAAKRRVTVPFLRSLLDT
ncbi:MAG: HdaA/DnaA family protein [Rudaea sp.]